MNQRIRGKIAAVAERIDALGLRERLLLLFVLVGGAWLLVDSAWVAPGWQRLQQAERAIGAAENRIAALTAALNEQAGGEDPVAVRERELAELEAELAARSQELETRLGELPEPREVPRLLRALLSAGGMELRHMAMEAVDEGPFDDAEAAEAGVQVTAYRLTLEGGYFDALDYLRGLERLPWALFQDRVRYQVEVWPRGRLELRLLALERMR